MKKSNLYLILLLGTVLAGGAVWAFKGRPMVSASSKDGKTLYQCSMHPQVVQDHPGNCPLCHMRLEKVVEEPEALPVSAKKPLKYRHPMDPTIFSDHPMKDSMGMDYIPVYPDEAGETMETQVPGKAGFTLSPGRQQFIGVRWSPARVQEVGQTLRLPARVSGGREALAELLEMDGGKVKVGTRAVLRGPEGKQVQAVVVSVDESLDNLSHTYSLRLRTAKAEPWMRPGAYCLALVPSGAGKALAVPQEAVLDTGSQQVVFVVQDKGRFEPRLVVLGRVGDEVVEVLSGLKAGDQVVTSANFLIDSESRFKAALSNY